MARFGGDEFVVLLTDLDEKRADEYTLFVAEKILERIREPITLDNLTLHSEASIGITLFPERAGGGRKDANEVLKRADTAMYHAKAEGRGRIRFFDRRLNEKAQYRLQMDTGMRRALEELHFDVFYQPIVDIATREAVGAEALVRWREEGLLHQPSDFIPIAEESSLILEISTFVIERVCRDLASGRIERTFGPIESVAVNLSANLFRIPEFETNILSLIQKSGIDPARLTFELTENVLVHDFEIIMEKILFFKRYGIRFSIDDFGTGYASLIYLNRLPLDTVKIDRSFIRHLDTDADNAKIVETIVDLSRHFGFDIVAEGVERAEEARCLEDIACRYAQGFYFSKPRQLDDKE